MRMKAIRVHAPGGPEALAYDDVDRPIPGPGQALVRIEAAGVNYMDVYQRTGMYPLERPFTLGQEASGTVVALGPDTGEVRAGDRVAYTGVQGAYAEFAAVPAERLVRLPDGVNIRQGAALLLQGMTAHYLATSTYPLKGSGGGVASCAALTSLLATLALLSSTGFASACCSTSGLGTLILGASFCPLASSENCFSLIRSIGSDSAGVTLSGELVKVSSAHSSTATWSPAEITEAVLNCIISSPARIR